MIDRLLELTSEDAALQLYAYPQGGNWGKDTKMVRIEKNDPEAVQRFLRENEDKNVYFNTSLMAKAKKGRGSSKDARVLPFLFADFDTEDGVHKGRRPSREAVRDMLNSGEVVPKPSRVIISGGGVHVYWDFDEPLDLSTEDGRSEGERLLEGLNNRILNWSKKNGYDYERLKDLARVLRVPGTNNHKTNPPKKVEIAWPKNGEPQTFTKEELTFESEPVAVAAKESTVTDRSTTFKVAMQACLKVEPEWGEDGSGYIIRLCRQCVRGGCDEQQTVEIVKTILRSHEDFPRQYSDEEILARYRNAGEQSDLGEAIKDVQERLSEYDFAHLVAARLDGRAIFIAEWKKWLVWNGRKFAEHQEATIYDAIVSTSKLLLDKGPASDGTKEGIKAARAWEDFCLSFQKVRNMEAIVRLLSKILSQSFRVLNPDPMKLHTQNCVIEFKRGKPEYATLPHDPKFMNTDISEVIYDPDAKCPRWEKFIEEVFVKEDGTPDHDLGIYVQRIFGLCLTGDVKYEQMFLFYGDGANGKSVLLEVMQALLGEYAMPVRQSLFMNGDKEHPTQLASLYGKRSIIAQETDLNCRLNENQVKMLTGGDIINCRRMYENEWSFVPTHKMILATNHRPNIRGTDHGIWRRVKLVPFLACFQGREEKELKRKLLAELSGVLQWALRGYEMVEDFLGMDEPACMISASKEYRESLDIVGQFLDEECELGEEFSEPFADLYQCFRLYCERNGNYVPSAIEFSKRLDKKGFPTARTNRARFKKGVRIVRSLP